LQQVRYREPFREQETKIGTDAITRTGEIIMINWAVTFLIIAIVAALLGFSGVAGAATNIAWILFVVGLVVAAIFFFTGRAPRV
jgi:uncharacterized membrane protein YtjA (UPF0391 family)